MFCPKCGKQTNEADSFCRFCGERFAVQQAPTTAKNQSNLKPLRILFPVLFTVILCVIVWQMWGEPGKRRRADQAIDAAVEACAQGGRAEFDHRVVEANLAIEDLDAVDMQVYEASLNNRLIEVSCR
jgi:uncharacterized membrane protein YvbJ